MASRHHGAGKGGLHSPLRPGAGADLEGGGAWVRVIEMKASSADGLQGDKPGAPPPRLRHPGAHAAFPWRVLVPLPVSPRLRGLLLLNLVCLACASAFVVLKESQQDVDPFVFSSLRFIIAAAMFSPFFRLAMRDERVVKAGVEIGVWAAAGYLTQSIGMLTADASRGAFLSGFTVVVVPLMAGLCGTAKLKRSTWAAVLACLVGISLLEDSGAPASWGDFWSFLSAVLFGAQIYRAEHWSKQLGAKQAMPMLAISLLMIAAISLASLAAVHPYTVAHYLANLPELAAQLRNTQLPWLGIIYMGCGVTNGGLIMEVIALQDVSSTEAAIIYTLEPVFGGALAYCLLGERWGPSGWLGAGLIVASCLAAQLLGVEKEKEEGKEDDPPAARLKS